MAATILNLDTANLFAGDADPTNSQFLTLNNIKFPALEEKTKAHSPGGGVMSINVGMRSVNALSLTFQLAGINPDVMNKYMPGLGRRTKYTLRGNLNDLQTQEDIPVLAVVNGRMTKSDIGQFDKDNGLNSDYEIQEIVGYQLLIGGTEKFYFDFFAGPRGIRIDGVVVYNTVARNLGLGV